MIKKTAAENDSRQRSFFELFYSAGVIVRVSFTFLCIPWTLKHESLTSVNTRWPDTPQRYAVSLDGKHKNVKLTLTITPAE